MIYKVSIPAAIQLDSRSFKVSRTRVWTLNCCISTAIATSPPPHTNTFTLVNVLAWVRRLAHCSELLILYKLFMFTHDCYALHSRTWKPGNVLSIKILVRATHTHTQLENNLNFLFRKKFRTFTGKCEKKTKYCSWEMRNFTIIGELSTPRRHSVIFRHCWSWCVFTNTT
jgi:hypothetical protein